METIIKIKDKKIVEIQKKYKGSKVFKPSNSLNLRLNKDSVFDFEKKELSDLANIVSFQVINNYYISSSTGNDNNNGLSELTPFKTISKHNESTIIPGSSIYFKRGDCFFGKLIPKSGDANNYISYDSYGIGEKPIIHNSIITTLADWTNNSINIWTYKNAYSSEIGNIVFNNDEYCGVQKDTSSLTTQGEYYYNSKTGILSLYSKVNPNALYSKVRLCYSTSCIDQSHKSYINYNNLSLKYTAFHGLGGHDISNINIKNIDVDWIGGGNYRGSRLGNGIELYGNCDNIIVENCTVSRCYDAGITNQNSTISGCSKQSNITFKNNIVTYCEYGFEYFNNPIEGSNTSNINVINNHFIYSGYGWGHTQRPDPSGYAIRLAGAPNDSANFNIKNNILFEAKGGLVFATAGNLDTYSVDYNCYFTTNPYFYRFHLTDYKTYKEFKDHTRWENKNSINDYPLGIEEILEKIN